MTPIEKLKKMLAERNHTVIRLSTAQGYYKRADCARWDAEVKHPNFPGTINLYSLDTVTKCVRNGFSIYHSMFDLPTTFCVTANERKKK